MKVMKLKRITTLNAADRYVDVASKTGKMKGDIYFIDTIRLFNEEFDVIWVDEWLLCLPAKQVKLLLRHGEAIEEMKK